MRWSKRRRGPWRGREEERSFHEPRDLRRLIAARKLLGSATEDQVKRGLREEIAGLVADTRRVVA